MAKLAGRQVNRSVFFTLKGQSFVSNSLNRDCTRCARDRKGMLKRWPVIKPNRPRKIILFSLNGPLVKQIWLIIINNVSHVTDTTNTNSPRCPFCQFPIACRYSAAIDSAYMKSKAHPRESPRKSALLLPGYDSGTGRPTRVCAYPPCVGYWCRAGPFERTFFAPDLKLIRKIAKRVIFHRGAIYQKAKTPNRAVDIFILGTRRRFAPRSRRGGCVLNKILRVHASSSRRPRTMTSRTLYA